MINIVWRTLQVKEFAELLEAVFILDPAKRITVPDALKHAFLN
jgi:hypothetical protein